MKKIETVKLGSRVIEIEVETRQQPPRVIEIEVKPVVQPQVLKDQQ